MQTEGERLRYYIESKEVSIRKYCVDNGILYTSLHPILKNSRPLGINILKKIMESYPNLNINWVLTGKGSVEINSEDVDAIKEPSPVYGKIDPGYVAFLKYLDNGTTIEKINKLIDFKLNPNVDK